MRLGFAPALLASASACSDSEGSGAKGGGGAGGGDAGAVVDAAGGQSGTIDGGDAVAPALPGPPAAGEWLAIEPGGDTVCARGTPYRFFVRGGAPDKVIVDFQGGGACWDELSCSIADSLFSDSTGELPDLLASMEAGQVGGIFDEGAAMPFDGWTIVHVPYCTGDVHWGNATKVYNDTLTIEHKGFVNSRAVLDWVYAHYAAPDNVFVSGCSAGAYGAIMHSAYIADHYADSKISVLADSGAGIITNSFLQDSLPNWGAQANLPPFIPALDVPLVDLTLPDVYIEIGKHFPQHRFAQTATQFDKDQIFYFTAMGGAEADWPGLFSQSLADIAAAIPNFRSYVPPGPMHCVTPYPFFNDRTVNDVKLSDWTAQLVTGDALPDSVACDGDACLSDPVCDACAVDSSDGWCGFCEGWTGTAP